ncbi:MAG TPA: deoxyribodipyrimidine photo-lyase [Sphingobacteriaceae bacterium]
MISTAHSPVTIFWFRRDLRLDDNTALFHALAESGSPVLPVFIFDRNILEALPDTDDPRVTFIHQVLSELDAELQKIGSGVVCRHDTPVGAFRNLLENYTVSSVYANADYEPYARERDGAVAALLTGRGIPFRTFKDHVIFEKDEVVKADQKPYTVFTPYKRAWLQRLAADPQQPGATSRLSTGFVKMPPEPLPTLADLGFTKSSLDFPEKAYRDRIADYASTRDFPAVSGTTHIGVHLRFGTVSIRQALADALLSPEQTWLSELIWRDFYSMILWHFPSIVHSSFKPEYDNIRWRNDPSEFRAWCEGRTGYPIVDAGMRELNATGYMHNRVRMIVASFLTKHLLIDWRWGESYFARKLLDYDQASNVGGWQWAAGSGNDAAPYFRIFNPELQTRRFDPGLVYIRKWVPEFADPGAYPPPLIDHRAARERALAVYRAALSRDRPF